MAYQYENVKLEKGMYGQSGKSFLKVLEWCDRAWRAISCPTSPRR